jgi:hypothetical protein
LIEESAVFHGGLHQAESVVRSSHSEDVRIVDERNKYKRFNKLPFDILDACFDCKLIVEPRVMEQTTTALAYSESILYGK